MEQMALGRVLEVVTVATADDGIACVELFYRINNEVILVCIDEIGRIRFNYNFL